ncbi:MOSC domain-containing protein [Kolteria novifilia]
MSEPASNIRQLMTRFSQPGRVEWIGRSATRRATIESCADVLLEEGTGIQGDHHATSGRSKRQVTLIQHEHLAAIASLIGQPDVSPEQLRRNIVVSGINLLSLKSLRFRIGETLLEGTGLCAPCSRMEETLGKGGYQATRGHGGITAVVLEGGPIRVGDAVRPEQSLEIDA